MRTKNLLEGIIPQMKIATVAVVYEKLTRGAGKARKFLANPWNFQILAQRDKD